LRAHERDVLQAGQPDIGDELAVATEETRVFLALQPRPDPAVGFIMGGHYVGVPVRIRFVPRARPDAFKKRPVGTIDQPVLSSLLLPQEQTLPPRSQAAARVSLRLDEGDLFNAASPYCVGIRSTCVRRPGSSSAAARETPSLPAGP